MVMICPYCDIEINEKLMENEDGCCPECGALITPSTVITEDEDDYYGDDFDEEDDDRYRDNLDEDEDFDDFDEEMP